MRRRPAFDAGLGAYHDARVERAQRNRRTTEAKPCRDCEQVSRFVKIKRRWAVIDSAPHADGTVLWVVGEVDAYVQGTEPDSYSAIWTRYRRHSCPPAPKVA